MPDRYDKELKQRDEVIAKLKGAVRVCVCVCVRVCDKGEGLPNADLGCCELQSLEMLVLWQIEC